MQRILINSCSLFTFFLLAASCAKLSIQGQTKISVSFDPVSSDKGHYSKVYIPFEKNFYLFGLVPKVHDIYVDQIIYQAGFNKFRRFKIEESRDFKNTAISVLTLGMWIPKKYFIVGEGSRGI